MARASFISAAILAPFLFGCSPSSNQAPAADSHQTVQGAFGWNFGQKLPENYPVQLDDSGVYCFNYETNGLFKQVTIGASADREICMIEGRGDATSLDISDKETLVKTLSDKYGLQDHYGTNVTGFGYVEAWKFGNGGSTAQLTVMDGTVTLLYRFDPTLENLQIPFQQEKERQFQTNLNGI